MSHLKNGGEHAWVWAMRDYFHNSSTVTVAKINQEHFSLRLMQAISAKFLSCINSQ